jgi:hypothetical protein
VAVSRNPGIMRYRDCMWLPVVSEMAVS